MMENLQIIISLRRNKITLPFALLCLLLLLVLPRLSMPLFAQSPDARSISEALIESTENNSIRDENTGFTFLPLISTYVPLRSVTEKGETIAINSATLSPDGERAAAVGENGSVYVWQIDSNSQSMEFTDHSGSVTAVTFSPDSQTIASADINANILLWDAATGEQTTVLARHLDRVNSLAYSPDGQRIVSGSSDGTLRLWDIEAATELSVQDVHFASVNSVTFSPDGQQIASAGSDAAVRIWDAGLAEQRVLNHDHLERVSAVAFSPDGQRVVSGDDGATVRIWNAETGAQLALLEGHQRRITSVGFFAEGERIFSAAGDSTAGEIRTWDAETGELLGVVEHPSAVNSLMLSAQGKQAILADANGQISLWNDFELDSEKRVIDAFGGHRDRITAIAFNKAGTQMATSDANYSVRMWDAASGRQIAIFDHGAGSVVFSPDDQHLVAGGYRYKIYIWDTDTTELVKEIDAHGNVIFGVGFIADGERLISSGHNTGSDYDVRVWDVDSGERISSFGPPIWVETMALSSDQKYMASGGQDNNVRIWDIDAGQQVNAFDARGGDVNSVAFSPDGQKVVSGTGAVGSGASTVRVWDAASGELLAELVGHTAAVQSVAFSPNGDRIVSGGVDGTTRVWDAVSGEPLYQFDSGEPSEWTLDRPLIVNAVTFSPDGTYVVSGYWDGSLREWNTP